MKAYEFYFAEKDNLRFFKGLDIRKIGRNKEYAKRLMLKFVTSPIFNPVMSIILNVELAIEYLKHKLLAKGALIL